LGGAVWGMDPRTDLSINDQVETTAYDCSRRLSVRRNARDIGPKKFSWRPHCLPLTPRWRKGDSNRWFRSGSDCWPDAVRRCGSRRKWRVRSGGVRAGHVACGQVRSGLSPGGDGFEPSVPGRETVRGDRTKLSKMGANQLGTEGSKPSPSSGESAAN
jgi:hypothetical protein